jgi:DNA-3-methyladenine glycosylase
MIRLTKIPRSFYLRPTRTVAKELLGLFLVRRIGRRIMAGRIVEVEAYRGAHAPASHAYRGRTKRNEVMFRNGGHLYVYFTYGMHYCANVVTETEGIGHAVLIRALEPTEGIAQMKKHRGNDDVSTLCSGPARLCQALGIGRADNGTDLCDHEIWIARGASSTGRVSISKTTRVGISQGKDHRWRFLITNSPFVSKGKPS